MFKWPVLQLKQDSNKRLLLLFGQLNFIEFLCLCQFFPHLLLSVILVKTVRLNNFNSLADLIPPRWWHFLIYIIFLIVFIMFSRIMLCLSNSINDFRIYQKMCFWSINIFICIYIAINLKSIGDSHLSWNSSSCAASNLNGSSSSDWLRAWLSEFMPAFLKQFTNVIREIHSQAAVSKVMSSNMLAFVGELPPSMLVI